MKILIVDDEKDAIERIRDVFVKAFPGAEVTLCTKELQQNPRGFRMPAFSEVQQLIVEHDIILIDGKLDSTPGHYSGREISLFCVDKGKPFIGISTMHQIGNINVHCKHMLNPEQCAAYEIQRASSEFIAAIRRVLVTVPA